VGYIRHKEFNPNTLILRKYPQALRGREHRVPLSPRAIAILRRLEKLKAGEFVFPGQARNKPLSNRFKLLV
jgi:integrase